MVKLQEAENQIVIDYEVYDRRPNDSDLLIAAIETHQARLGTHAAPGGGRRRFLLRQERDRRESEGRQTRLRSQSLHEELGAQTRAEETLVPQRPKVADRVRGTY